MHEITQALPNTNVADILFKGGWPELYIDANVSPIAYLNHYIRSYIEKDVVLSAGVQKQTSFTLVLSLLAARTGMLIDYSNIARDSGIQSVTVKEWISILQRASLLYYLKPYASNLNKRLTKAPKLYFLDTGLATRLQGWGEQTPLMTSPQAGALFETLVFAEIIKFIENYAKDWQLFLWRTKEAEEIDFILITSSGRKVTQMILVTFGGETLQLSNECMSLPITALHDFLSMLDA